ncbi:MAG: glycosyltransferase family 2 protein, partial [Candidatus Dormibacteraceae bacterium]
PIVALLNNDTEAEPDWLAALARPLDDDPELGMAASKLLLFDRRHVLHSAGDFFGRDGMPGNRGVWQEDRGQFDHDRDPFGACGGAAAYRRALFDRIGLFDEALGSYCEDVDLNVRARLAGFRCRFAPDARVYHRLSATGGGVTSSYYVGRNVLWVLAQDVPSALLGKYWPRILARQLSVAVEALRHWREPAARARLRGQIDGLRGLAGPLAKRREIQRQRRVSIAALDAALS